VFRAPRLSIGIPQTRVLEEGEPRVDDIPKSRVQGSILEMPLRLNLYELLAFLHRELRSRYSSLIQRSSSILPSFTSIFL